MKHSTRCKLYYAFYTIPTFIKCKLKGVKLSINVFWGGFPYIYHWANSNISIGANCRFMSKEYGNLMGLNHRCILATGNPEANLIIGDKCSFSGVSLWCFDSICIGNNVRVGANVTIMDGDAHQDDPRVGCNKPIIIGDNVWIGANVLILKGVTVGKNTLIGAGSVVTRSIPENVIAAGNPCSVVRELKKDIIEQF